MIDLYTWPTPDGHTVHVMLEECALPHAVHAVDIGAGEQFASEFVAISPNNQVPAIVDHDGPSGESLAVFESGAILLYLAEKTGRFLPAEPAARYRTLQWLTFQMAGAGPMLGQAHRLRLHAPDRTSDAIERYTNETRRLYGVMDRQLARSRFLAGDDYTIADVATFAWTRSHAGQGVSLDEFAHVERWIDEVEARPAVRAGCTVLADRHEPLAGDWAREALFGGRRHRPH